MGVTLIESLAIIRSCQSQTSRNNNSVLALSDVLDSALLCDVPKLVGSRLSMIQDLEISKSFSATTFASGRYRAVRYPSCCGSTCIAVG